MTLFYSMLLWMGHPIYLFTYLLSSLQLFEGFNKHIWNVPKQLNFGMIFFLFFFLLHPFPSLTIPLSSLLVGYESRKLKITFNAKYTISNNISLWNVLTSAKRLISVQEFSWKCSIPFKILVWIEWQACKSLQHLTWKQNEVKEVAEYFFTFFP